MIYDSETWPVKVDLGRTETSMIRWILDTWVCFERKKRSVLRDLMGLEKVL